MNNKLDDIDAYFKKFNKLIAKDKTLKIMGNVIIGVAPTAISLLPVVCRAKKGILTVAQNVYYKQKGSYTGCISYDQVHEYNINYSIVGHYETRTIFNLKEMQIETKIKIEAIECLNQIGKYLLASSKIVFLFSKIPFIDS